MDNKKDSFYDRPVGKEVLNQQHPQGWWTFSGSKFPFFRFTYFESSLELQGLNIKKKRQEKRIKGIKVTA